MQPVVSCDFEMPVTAAKGAPLGASICRRCLQLPVPLAPLADGHHGQPHPFGYGCVGFTGATGNNVLGTLNDGVCR